MDLFKESKKSDNQDRENSYYNARLKKRIYYDVVAVEDHQVDAYLKKGYHVGLPRYTEDEPQVTSDGTENGQVVNTESA